MQPLFARRHISLGDTDLRVWLDLGRGNEIAGGVWISCASIAGWIAHSLGKIAVGLGLLTGAGGLLTLIPVLGDVVGATFGLGAIAWFIAIGFTLTCKHDPALVRAFTTTT